jgi:catechol 2,3-dioxygenase-like lactoylglutathione lyase family enzyme
MADEHTGRDVFAHVHLRVSDLEASARFYETVLAPLGLRRRDAGSVVQFGTLAISDDGPASQNVHLAFNATSPGFVDAFHAAGIEAGYRDNGAPGFRDYWPGYYAAYVLDPDGNNVEALAAVAE